MKPPIEYRPSRWRKPPEAAKYVSPPVASVPTDAGDDEVPAVISPKTDRRAYLAMKARERRARVKSGMSLEEWRARKKIDGQSC